MINELINKNAINSVEFVGTLNDEEQITSFGNTISGKYAYISEYGYIFNFNTMLCGKQTFGNYLSNKNFDDMASIEIVKYDNNLKDGGIIQRKRAGENIINLKLTITSNNIANLEKEIRQIKSIFNGNGKLYKKEFDRELNLNVVLADSIKVGEKSLAGTELDISFLSLDPFWKTQNGISINYEAQTIPLVGTLTITDSDNDTPLKSIVQVKGLNPALEYMNSNLNTYINNLNSYNSYNLGSGNLSDIQLNLNGYIIEVDQIISPGDIIVFDGSKSKVYINGNEVFYKGTFRDFPINTPRNIGFTYSGGGSINTYNFYILYDKIAL